MIDGLNPGFILILGALLVPLTSGFIRSLLVLALPVLGFAQMISLGLGSWGVIDMLGLQVVLTHIDPLSRVFGIIFHIAAFAALLYSLHVKDTVQHIATLIYAGSAIGAIFAGDLLTLFVFWEITAVSSVFLIWASRTERAFRSGVRYLIIQVTSGVILLGGIALYVADTGSLAFGPMELGSFATWAFLIAFGIKAAFPLLHNWVQDSYPEATVTGTVVLSAFTTKLAIYALARAFPGTDLLIYIGVVMVIFPVVFATLENDLRRTLAYSMNSQQGFMVIGIGIGTEMALNGVAAHASVSILYTCLLFMCTGAILYRTGTAKATELGSLYKSMPLTAFFAVIGSLVIVAFPLTAAFASKSLILSASLKEGYYFVWLFMLFGAVAVIDNIGLKIPVFGFFRRNAEKDPAPVQDAPAHMLLAMALLTGLAILAGVMPGAFFSLLPYDVSYEVYTASHVVTQLQLILFATLAFALALRLGVYPGLKSAINLDFDWFYRKAGKSLAITTGTLILTVWTAFINLCQRGVAGVISLAVDTHGDGKTMSRTVSSSAAVVAIVALFGVILLVAYQF
ncbi:Na(+)/H(+) antiporter subunit D [Sneathiella chinensis]|uniref:Na(+)/H(+) antiporter subunit D n=1 Tax=Sneathiella chinensis TaxID=349750 RepID=A0ABQ5U706_9PROT|nr:Na(+)/H(+) antiporter subunit D [Sneathiella chinensis]GLQ07092.1 Na(+)/H(+) antiporter subunit D [Sneathiella chinensis]